MIRFAIVLFAALASGTASAAEEFKIEEVDALVPFDAAKLKPSTILYTDFHKSEMADPVTGLIRFTDWERLRPEQKQFLSLYPAYVEPTVKVTVHGIVKSRKVKLHVYVTAARFGLAKAPAAIDLAHYVTLPFVQGLDPMIKDKLITAADVMPAKDANLAYNLRPDRPWCEAAATVLCIQSHYKLEGKLPTGIALANKLRDSSKKIADYMEFQSELRVVPQDQIDGAGLAKLTGLESPVSGVLEQNIFWVNQVMQFGKFMAIFQPFPSDSARTVVTVFMALAVETDLLDKKKEYEKVPVLRNLVPALVLAGKSSFNSGTSISAGLPDYTRNRIKAIAAILDRE